MTKVSDEVLRFRAAEDDQLDSTRMAVELLALRTEHEALKTVLDLCMEEIPQCRAYGDLPGWIKELRAAEPLAWEEVPCQQCGKTIFISLGAPREKPKP